MLGAKNSAEACIEAGTRDLPLGLVGSRQRTRRWDIILYRRMFP